MGEHSQGKTASKADISFNIRHTKISLSFGEGKSKIAFERKGKYRSLKLTKNGLSVFRYNSRPDFARIDRELNLVASKSYSEPLSINLFRRLIMKKDNRIFIEAVKAFIDNDNKLALNELQKVPNNIDAAFMRGVIEQIKGNYHESLVAFDKVLNDPHKLGVVLEKYRIFFKLNLNLGYTQTMPIYFDERCLLICMSMIYSELKMYQEAYDILWELHLQNTKDLEVMLLIAKLIAENISHEELYKETLYMISGLENKTPQHVLILLYKAQILQKMANFKAANNTLTYALQRHKSCPQNLIHELLYEQGLICEKLKQKTRAKKNYRLIYAQNKKFKDVAERIIMRSA